MDFTGFGDEGEDETHNHIPANEHGEYHSRGVDLEPNDEGYLDGVPIRSQNCTVT